LTSSHNYGTVLENIGEILWVKIDLRWQK